MTGDDDRRPETVYLAGRTYARVRVGEERPPCESPCPGCGAYFFDVHAPGCEFEQCPRCGGALASCSCADSP